MIKNIFKSTILLLVAIGLVSCGAAQTLIKKRNLDVQTKMSETIFLEPSASNQKNLYVSIRNTSDKKLTVESNIKSILTSKGYTLTKDPGKAHFTLQVNILKVGKSDLRASQSALSSGFGGALIGSSFGGTDKASAGLGLAAGIAGFVGDALVSDTFYSMVTDIQVRERPLSGETITQIQSTSLTKGSNAAISQNTNYTKVNWKTYRSRIVSTANQVNLDFKDAKLKLEEGLTRSISGLF